VSGGRFVANGSKGVTFTFAVGTGVPAGENAVVTALPTPPPCVAPGPHVRAESSLLGRDLHDDDPAAVATVPGV